MKTTKHISQRYKQFMICVIFGTLYIIPCLIAHAQNPTMQVAAVLGINSKGVLPDSESVTYMVRLELEKANVYNIMDKYDVTEIMKKSDADITSCFGKSCVVAAGKILNADKMITGSVERFGERIIIALKVIDVKTDRIENQNTTEYLNLQPELQRMIAVSVQKLVGIKPDQNTENLLINYNTPPENPRTKVMLNGPRMGFSVVGGDAATVLEAPESEGGYNMYPVSFQFGWQKEWQYLSAGEFQALVEIIPMIGGLESGQFIPSLTFLNGFRVGKQGWEFAFGPSFRAVEKAEGYFGDGTHGTKDGHWYLAKEWESTSVENPFPVMNRLDSRGELTLSSGLFFGIGKTFHSGYLNIPVNAYIIPRKEGSIMGFSFGFNIVRKPRAY